MVGLYQGGYENICSVLGGCVVSREMEKVYSVNCHYVIEANSGQVTDQVQLYTARLCRQWRRLWHQCSLLYWFSLLPIVDEWYFVMSL